MGRTTRKIDGTGAFKIRKKLKDDKPSLKEKVETYGAIAALFYKISAAIGAIIVFAYLFEIGFFPTGLTAAEVIFFIFVAMGFGLLYLILITFAAVSAIWLINAGVWLRNCLIFERRRGTARWKAWQLPQSTPAIRFHRIRFRATRISKRVHHPLHPELRGGFYLCLSIAFSVLLLSLAMLTKDHSVRPEVGIFLAGLVALISANVEMKENKIKAGKKGLWTSSWFRAFLTLGFPLVILFTFGGGTELLHLVFQRFGIRTLNASVEIPVAELDSVERIADAQNRPLLDCRRSSAGDKLLVHHANVLWTEVGSTTDLSFEVYGAPQARWLAPDPGPLQQATLKLDTASIHILDAKPPLNPCFDLPNDMLFGSASYELTAEAKDELRALASSIQHDGQPARIIVRGHSDARRIGGRMERDVGDNQRLSERRAEAVAQALRALMKVPGLVITSEGVSSREPKVSCPAGGSTTLYEAQQCNAPNRRVEIRVTYALVPARS